MSKGWFTLHKILERRQTACFCICICICFPWNYVEKTPDTILVVSRVFPTQLLKIVWSLLNTREKIIVVSRRLSAQQELCRESSRHNFTGNRFRYRYRNIPFPNPQILGIQLKSQCSLDNEIKPLTVSPILISGLYWFRGGLWRASIPRGDSRCSWVYSSCTGPNWVSSCSLGKYEVFQRLYWNWRWRAFMDDLQCSQQMWLNGRPLPDPHWTTIISDVKR